MTNRNLRKGLVEAAILAAAAGLTVLIDSAADLGLGAQGTALVVAVATPLVLWLRREARDFRDGPPA